jgi:hypothetical protein
MGITIGPVDWWLASPQGYSGLIAGCPVGTSLPDGSKIICKAGGTAWIVAPSNTEVSQSWNNSTGTLVGNKLCVCDWPTLNTCLINRGFNPSDWFVPCYQLLQNPGYVCRTQWDAFSAALYWSSTESSATTACIVGFNLGNAGSFGKTCANCVRAFRCVTY